MKINNGLILTSSQILQTHTSKLSETMDLDARVEQICWLVVVAISAVLPKNRHSDTYVLG